MYLIVGLGNPGLSYAKTRHNAGFQALDVLAKRLNVRIKTKGFSALYGEGRIDGERVILMKPQTYMNNSGEAVQSMMHFYKLEPDRMIVLYDDIDLPLGSMRIRANGSAGTHNGMRSILSCIHSKAEQGELKEVFEHAADAAIMIVQGELAEAQMKYNKKHEKNQSVSIDGHGAED